LLGGSRPVAEAVGVVGDDPNAAAGLGEELADGVTGGEVEGGEGGIEISVGEDPEDCLLRGSEVGAAYSGDHPECCFIGRDCIEEWLGPRILIGEGDGEESCCVVGFEAAGAVGLSCEIEKPGPFADRRQGGFRKVEVIEAMIP